MGRIFAFRGEGREGLESIPEETRTSQGLLTIPPASFARLKLRAWFFVAPVVSKFENNFCGLNLRERLTTDVAQAGVGELPSFLVHGSASFADSRAVHNFALKGRTYFADLPLFG